jgi:hypothetical protein
MLHLVAPAWNIVYKANKRLALDISRTVINKSNSGPLIEKVVSILKKSSLAKQLNAQQLKSLADNVVYFRSKNNVAQQFIGAFFKGMFRSRL